MFEYSKKHFVGGMNMHHKHKQPLDSNANKSNVRHCIIFVVIERSTIMAPLVTHFYAINIIRDHTTDWQWSNLFQFVACHSKLVVVVTDSRIIYAQLVTHHVHRQFRMLLVTTNIICTCFTQLPRHGFQFSKLSSVLALKTNFVGFLLATKAFLPPLVQKPQWASQGRLKTSLDLTTPWPSWRCATSCTCVTPKSGCTPTGFSTWRSTPGAKWNFSTSSTVSRKKLSRTRRKPSRRERADPWQHPNTSSPKKKSQRTRRRARRSSKVCLSVNHQGWRMTWMLTSRMTLARRSDWRSWTCCWRVLRTVPSSPTKRSRSKSTQSCSKVTTQPLPVRAFSCRWWAFIKTFRYLKVKV